LDLKGCTVKFIYDITGVKDSVLFLGQCYGLDIPVFVSQQGHEVIFFLHMSNWLWGLPNFLLNGYQGFFLGGKVAGRDV
jgi:hypothetical protein